MQRVISILLVIAGVILAGVALFAVVLSSAAPAWILSLAVVLIGTGFLVGILL